MTSLKLREYQEKCLQSIRDHHQQGINRQLISLPTGSGKTVIFASLISQLKCRTLVLAHTNELLSQAKEKIEMINPELNVGLVNANNKEFDKQVVVSSIQSARQEDNLEQLKSQGFQLLIYDEAHRSNSPSSIHVINSLGFGNETKQLLVGFSATPFRNDSKGLGEIFEKIVYHRSIKDLISLGYLCQPKGIKIKTDLDLSTIQTEDGDFKTESLASYMNTPEMNELIVNSYIENSTGKKSICFAVSVDHAKNLSNSFKSREITSEAIYGSMPQDERQSLLKRFKNNDIQVLTNCQVLTEGFDEASIDTVIMARPTQSKGLYTQCVGRGLRLWPNKPHCTVLDFGSQSHSLCSTAILTLDSEEEEKQSSEGKLSEFAKGLPATINKKLKAAIIEFDLLGDSFTWTQDGQSFSLKAWEDKSLKIFPTAEGRFSVMFFDKNTSQTIAKELSFEYAFSTAESFAKENRSIFSVSDLEAPWRSLPISDKQRRLFKSFNYRAGIEDLSRGQAALIISSGVLNKKTVR